MPKSTTLTKFFFPLRRCGVRRHVEVFGPQADQQIAHRAADDVGLEAGVGERAHDLDGALVDQRLQRPALEELHDEEAGAVLGGVEVEDLEDVVVPDHVDRARFVEEAVDDLLLVRVLRVEELDRHLAADDGVAKA